MAHPYWHLDGYMERYWLFRIGRKPAGAGVPSPEPDSGEDRRQGRFGAARVHHILRSDRGRDYHDHPWPFLTIILRGGYYEVRPMLDASGNLAGESRKWHGPGSILLRAAGSWHRLELPAGQSAWTLFCVGPKRQEWGFLVDGTKVPRLEYFRRYPEAAP